MFTNFIYDTDVNSRLVVWKSPGDSYNKWDITKRLKDLNISAEIKTIGVDDDTIEPEHYNLIVVDVVTENNPENFKKLSEVLRSDFVQNNIWIDILFWMPTEVHTKSWHYSFFREQNVFLRAVPNHQCYMVTGDINGNINYLSYIESLPEERQNKLKKFEEIYNINYFEGDYRDIWFPSINEEKDIDFICLMRRKRPYRAALLTKLFSIGVVKDNAVSFLDNWEGTPGLEKDRDYHNARQYLMSQELGETDTLQEIIYSDSINYVRKIDIDYDSEAPNSSQFKLAGFPLPNKFMRRAYFGLVSETLVEELFITEKTYNTIMMGLPFIIWSCPGILKQLKRQGYKTFDGIMFDESYDNEESDSIRLHMITTEVKKFCNHPKDIKEKLFQKAKPIIEHNRMLLLKNQNNYREDFIVMINDMMKKRRFITQPEYAPR